MDELLTVDRLDLPGPLRRCLSTTHLIESSGVQQKTHRVTDWKHDSMALRWAATAFVETERNYRRIVATSYSCRPKPRLMNRTKAKPLPAKVIAANVTKPNSRNRHATFNYGWCIIGSNRSDFL
jgi:hypothetical protein